MKLSIITLNLNNAAGLQKTIESVVNQTFTDYEYIIIDGGSTDNSVDVIKQYADKITYWVSEPDKGIYHAMNKGILEAKGVYCLFLNSGDYLYNENVLFDFSIDLSGYDIVFANVFYIHGDHDFLMKYDYQMTIENFVLYGLPHSSGAVIKRSCFQTVGYYIEELKISSDWCWYLKAIFWHKMTYKYKPIVLGYYEDTGLSSNLNNRKLLFDERKTFCEQMFPGVYDLIEEKKYLELKIKEKEIVEKSIKALIRQLFSLTKKRLFAK